MAGHLLPVDVAGVVHRSDIVLARANREPASAMPLGNGTLGAAVWTADGLTVQLNRGDSWPNRLSPGQVVLPGLARLTQAHDFSGRLDLYNGEYQATGGGMGLTVFLDKSTDALEIDITGADPATLQTATLKLWTPRQPQVRVSPGFATLAETWKDTGQDGSGGQTFGTLAALTAEGRDLQVEQASPLSVTVSVRPRPDGTLRILVAAPHWAGGDEVATSQAMLAKAASLSPDNHLEAWHRFWQQATLMKLSSLDGAAEYFENLRLIDLYTAAGESLDRFPGSQAGIGDLFSSIQDSHNWGPADYWHWNLRMQVAANLGAGVPSLNASFFRLYRENLTQLLAWTRTHMAGRDGVCVPETMRFTGQGYENESWLHGPAPINCGEDSKPYYNARTISTGAEVSLWVWEQYRFTRDVSFLRENYPLMRESARFLLAYATRDANGVLHTFPANAHENLWDVHDPITDIASMRTLFPAVAEAAAVLGTDPELAANLRMAAGHLPPLPEVSLSDPGKLIQGNASTGDTILAESYDPAAPIHNVENDALEPVWPYSLIGDEGPLHEAAVRTFGNRRNKWEADWSLDPIQAARLGLSDEVESSLRGLTQRYQAYPSGMAKFEGPEFYVEQIGVLTDALGEALVQDYDDLLRFAPAWPSDWSAEADVAIHDGGRVRVRVQYGKLLDVAIETGQATHLRLRNPWPGEGLSVFDQKQPAKPRLTSRQAILDVPVTPGTVLLLQRASEQGATAPTPMTGERAKIPKRLGNQTLGLFAAPF